MFSLSKIKNKKAFLLQIIILSILGTKCYGMEETIKETIKAGLGTKDNPAYLNFRQIQDPQPQEELWKKIAWGVGPTILGFLLREAMNRWNEDPELNSINKEQQKINLELKTIELELKKHPDYAAIHLLHKKNEEEEKANENKQTHLTLEAQKAQLLTHHQQQLTHFLKCAEKGSSEAERRYCKDMYTQHDNLMKQLFTI